MTRESIQTAAAYHRITSYRRHALTPHALDWAHQPQLDKRYPKLAREPLPTPSELPRTDYFDLVRCAREALPSPSAPLDCKNLSTLLHLTHAITARSRQGGQPFYFRSVASAGALYPFEMYLAAHDIQGLAPGVYHFDVFTFGLARLRSGRVPTLPAWEGVAATVYITGIFFRSAWKYRNRAYRYVLLDAGHLLENLRLAAHALGVGLSIHMDFDDARIASLLGLDEDQEVCLIGVHLHTGAGGARNRLSGPAGDIPPLAADIRDASHVSDKVISYGEILDIHRAGTTVDGLAGGSAGTAQDLGWCPPSWLVLPAVTRERRADYVQALWQRRSRRNFLTRAISMADLVCFLDSIVDAMMADLPGLPQGLPLVGVLAGEGLPVAPGVYALDSSGRRLGLVAAGNRMEDLAHASLDQMWLKNAALHLLFLADPVALDQAWGARGYRYAMISAGRLGQQAYLAATAMGWGACGIGAIYDREAADRLGLADDGALLYLVGIGPIKGR